jgi:hypothetical protein
MGRLLLAAYAECGSPELRLEEIVEYKPKQMYRNDDDAWERLISRVIEVDNDGMEGTLIYQRRR